MYLILSCYLNMVNYIEIYKKVRTCLDSKHSEDEWCRLQLNPFQWPISTAFHNHSLGVTCNDYFHKRETSSLLARTTPVPSLALMNIMNLRELIEKCSEDAELEPNSSIVLSDIVVKGKKHHWEHFFVPLWYSIFQIS